MNESERFACYLSLGDSMSIDTYPAQDQRISAGSNTNLGAASLLFKNVDDVWPEFAGQDLNTLFPKIYFSDHTFDGATISDLLTTTRMSELEPFQTARTIVTLTVGGNDLLEALRATRAHPADLEKQFAQIQQRYTDLLSTLQTRLKNALFLVSTVYDPTDGTGMMPVNAIYQKLPIEYLQQFNEFIRASVATMDQSLFCDVHGHFLGHGITAGDEMWYWIPSPIEPGARGASEIRRVWMSGLTKWLSR